MTPWLTVEDVRVELGIRSRSQVYALIQSGRLAAERCSGDGVAVARRGRPSQWRVAREVFDAFRSTYRQLSQQPMPVAEAAQVLGYSRTTIWKWQQEGRLPRPLTREAVLRYRDTAPLSERAMARLLGVDCSVVRGWIARGYLPPRASRHQLRVIAMRMLGRSAPA